MPPKVARIIVVLGMHRSGTSAVARGLEVLGVYLGEKLMPAAPGNNEKGFFEDLEANAINTDVLRALGREWDAPLPLEASDLARADLAEHHDRAVALLRERLAHADVYGMKDPRTSLLLPFWKRVFAAAKVEPAYVICGRHPQSVADSLNRRDGIEPQGSHYLWLAYTAAAVVGSQGRPRVVVDFDRLMEDPRRELGRIARALSLPFDAQGAGTAEYVDEFLSESLRHSHHSQARLEGDGEFLRGVEGAYAMLWQLARDEASPDAAQTLALFERELQRLKEVRPALLHILQRKSAAEAQALAFHRDVVAHATRVHELNLAAIDRDHQLQDLLARAAERDTLVHNLNLAALQRDEEIKGLLARAAERDTLVHTLNLAALQRDEEIKGLLARAAERDARIAERDARIAATDQHVANLEAARLALTAQLRTAEEAHAISLDALQRTEAELELNRLRLLDGIRSYLREGERASQLEARVGALSARLAESEGAIAVLQGEVARRDRILDLVEHRAATALGRLFEPFPRLRSLLRAPIRLLHKARHTPG